MKRKEQAMLEFNATPYGYKIAIKGNVKADELFNLKMKLITSPVKSLFSLGLYIDIQNSNLNYTHICLLEKSIKELLNYYGFLRSVVVARFSYPSLRLRNPKIHFINASINDNWEKLTNDWLVLGILPKPKTHLDAEGIKKNYVDIVNKINLFSSNIKQSEQSMAKCITSINNLYKQFDNLKDSKIDDKRISKYHLITSLNAKNQKEILSQLIDQLFLN